MIFASARLISGRETRHPICRGYMTSEPKAEEPKVTPAAGEPAAAAETAKPEAPAQAKAYVDPSIAAELEVTKLEAQVKDLTDRLLRAHAEMENIRKRTERDKADTIKYAITRFAGDIIGVGDNFQRAVAAVPARSSRRFNLILLMLVLPLIWPLLATAVSRTLPLDSICPP